MLKPLTLIPLFVLIVTFASVHAQDEPAPWPPDPAEIFAPGVKVEDIWITGTEGSIQVHIDQVREFVINGLTYPWPDNFEDAWSYPDENPIRAIEGMSYVFAIEKGDHEQRVWQINLSTGEYVPYGTDTIHTPCGEFSPYELDREWIFYEVNEVTHLCQLSTGFMSEPLPDGVNWNVKTVGDQPVGISASVNSEWLAFFGYDPDSIGWQTSIYSYHLPNQQITKLGTFVREPDNLDFALWVDNQVLFTTSEMPEWRLRYVYIADAAHSNSLELATQRFRYGPEYYDNPPRFEFISGNEGNNSVADCTWIQYDIRSRHEEKYELGSLCDAEYGVVDGIGYYREVKTIDEPESVLVRFNPITETRVELFKGEIESIEWVSSDEQFAILTLDRNGRIDAIPFYPVYLWSTPQNPYLVLVNLASDEILYQIPTRWIWHDYHAGEDWEDFAGSAAYIQPLENGHFFAVEASPEGSISANILELKDNQVARTPLPLKIVVAMPKSERLLVWRDGQATSTAVDIYHMLTGETIPFIKAFDKRLYKLEFKPLREDYLFVYVIPADANQPPNSSEYERSVRYTINISSLDFESQ